MVYEIWYPAVTTTTYQILPTYHLTTLFLSHRGFTFCISEAPSEKYVVYCELLNRTEIKWGWGEVSQLSTRWEVQTKMRAALGLHLTLISAGVVPIITLFLSSLSPHRNIIKFYNVIGKYFIVQSSIFIYE